MTVLTTTDKIVSSKNMNDLKIVLKIPGFWMKIFEAILSIATVYLIYLSYIETHSIHTYHIVLGTSFSYFLITGTLITEYFSEESSHFTESLFLILGIPFEIVVALISSIYLSGHFVRYWIAREFHAFFISGSAGYFVISVVFIMSYIQDRPNVLLEATLLLIMGIINLAFGILACISEVEAGYEDEVHLIPLGILMILCGVVSLIDWLLQRINGGWDRYYTPPRLPHRRRSIY